MAFYKNQTGIILQFAIFEKRVQYFVALTMQGVKFQRVAAERLEHGGYHLRKGASGSKLVDLIFHIDKICVHCSDDKIDAIERARQGSLNRIFALICRSIFQKYYATAYFIISIQHGMI